MKLVARISLGLNLLLLGGWVLTRSPQRSDGISSPAPAEAPTAVVAADPGATRGPKIEPTPFRWSQLESPDYREYVRNLRKAGCPERTLRAIVTAEVDANYRRKSSELERKIDELNSGSLTERIDSRIQQQDLRDQLTRLSQEEHLEIIDLLGLQPAPGLLAGRAGTTEVPGRQGPPSAPAVMPLVLQPVDLAALNLNEQQIQVISELRQQFVDEIGGLGQDAHDPAYRDRWQKAQPEMDDNLRGMLGVTLFEDYQLAAQSPGATANQGAH